MKISLAISLLMQKTSTLSQYYTKQGNFCIQWENYFHGDHISQVKVHKKMMLKYNKQIKILNFT